MSEMTTEELKQNGHPVTSKDIWFNHQKKPISKEASDVHTQYSSLFPLSSNQNIESNRYPRCNRGSYPGRTRQEVSTYLSSMWTKGIWYPQLDSAQNSRLKLCYGTDLDYLPISKSILCSLPRYPYRGSGVVSSASSCNDSFSPLYLSTMQRYDRLRSSSSPRHRLENG